MREQDVLIRGNLSVCRGEMGIKKEEYQPLDCPNHTITQKSTTRFVLCTLFLVQLILLVLWVFTLAEKSKNGQNVPNLEKRRSLPSNMNPVFVDTSSFRKNEEESYNVEDGNESFGDRNSCPLVSPDERFDCYPEEETTEANCLSRFCCWQETALYGVPSCYYPRNYGGYRLLNISEKVHGLTVFISRTFPSPYPGDVRIVKIDVNYYTDHITQIKMTDAKNERYEPPLPEIPLVPGSKFKKAPLKARFTEKGLSLSRPDGNVFLETELCGAFIFADQLLQMSLKFNGKIYGLGEHQTSLQLDTNWTKYTFFARDGVPVPGANLYGSHPFYMVMDSRGLCYGVFFHNSNAMDVILQPLPAITFRSIGGIFNFYVFLGPTPADVIKQYTEVVGRPFLPPYWSLGFHLSRLGYKDTSHIREVWERTRAANIPFDTQWHDIDYMERKNDFTYDKNRYSELPDFVDEIHQAGMHYVPIIDPGISGCEANDTYPPYDEGVKSNVFLKFENGSLFVGKVWNEKCTVFPDFTAQNTSIWWGEQIRKFHYQIPFDGIWLDMNEPSNFLDGTLNGCPNNSLENPPYYPRVRGGKLSGLTVCMSTVHSAGYHYNVHNLYGLSETVATYRALEALGKRPFIISRSTYPGSGRYAGHWSGDVLSTWEAMRQSIPKMLSFSLFGIPMMGTDICGFNGNTTVALCQRWSQLGAFYPFSRNHNSDDCIDQDPVALGKDVVVSARNALLSRYALLPYLYTLFYRAHTEGETVARPLFVEFWYDNRTHDIDDAFLWGCCILIAPVLEPDVTTVNVYLPEGRWYNWFTGFGIDSSGLHVTVPAPSDTIPGFIRGGAIIPTQPPAANTHLSRMNSIDLVAAFSKTLNGSGMLYWDDGETPDPINLGMYGKIQYRLNSNKLTGRVDHWGCSTHLTLGSIKILGFWKPVSNVRFNRQTVYFTWNSTSLVLTVKVDHPMKLNFIMQWE